ncbi:Asparaginase [Rhizoctonia solani]|uniref:Asparaginase n=1 Tax=Rhizoctonia solani TaxID=456999 RepID=A0A8H7I8Q9_9AGAM|nr:Asparaginase [Rhizoctonia solani]
MVVHKKFMSVAYLYPLYSDIPADLADPPYTMLNNMSKKGSDENLVEKPNLAAHTLKGEPGPVLVIHGGAGLLLKKNSTPAQRELYKEALRKALVTGNDVLKSGGQAMDAAVAAVTVLEDCPLFNAGHGAVFNAAGKASRYRNELEASIMLSHPPPSIHLFRPRARMVRALYLEPTLAPHAFLSGAAAEEIGHQVGQELVDPSYYWTEHRWREHRRGLGLPETPLPGEPSKAYHTRHSTSYLPGLWALWLWMSMGI